jgi:hypothetical protein
MLTRKLLLVVAATSCFAEGTLSQGERDRAMSHLHATRKMMLDTVTRLSDTQWKFKPAPDAWSVGEIAEHLAVTEDLIYGLIQKALAEPPAPEKKTETKEKDEQVLKMIADRSRKFQAPEMIRPSGKYSGRTAVVDAFRDSRDRTIEFVKTTQADLRSHFAPHPVMGSLDGYQWALLISAHTDRHVQQMKEVIANPSFPKQ